MKKKMMLKKKQNVQEAGWATAHLPMLGHDTGNCIMTQSWGCRLGRLKEARHGWAST